MGLLFSLQAPLYAQLASSPCPQIVLKAERSISLNETERRLVCGDEESEAYQVIPLFQAQFLLEGMLQSRGYLKPEFLREDQLLTVHLGTRARLDKVEIKGREDLNDQHRELRRQVLRYYRNQVVTPNLLNEIESYARNYLRERSFACINVTSQFKIDSNTLEVQLKDEVEAVYGEVEIDPVDGLQTNALRRFHPFRTYHPFDSRKIRLNELRVLRSGVAQGTYFRQRCQNNKPHLKQYFVLGPPRVLRFGAGLNSEVGPIARVRWAHQRSGDMASRYDADLQASFREQSLTLRGQQHLFPESPRLFLRTTMGLTREEMSDYEEIVLRIGPHLARTYDQKTAGWTLSFGPTLISGTSRVKGFGRSLDQTTGAIELGLSRTTHLYELFDLHPEAGVSSRLGVEYRHPTLGFNEEILKIETSHVFLQRLTEWGDGHLVGGIRLGGASTLTRGNTIITDLPPSLKFYGGGFQDIRGFRLRSLPKNDGRGALSKLAMRAELRKTRFLTRDLESFIFFDEVRFGQKSMRLDPTRYFSPGLGFRWNSPIGLVQTSFALNRQERPTRDWGRLFFIGIGGTL